MHTYINNTTWVCTKINIQLLMLALSFRGYFFVVMLELQVTL